MSDDPLRALIRTIPDFPKPGIQFRDITTVLRDAEGFGLAIARMKAALAGHDVTMIAGIEARGFIFGAALARELGLGFVPVRKPGKLPVPVLAIDYALEYGTDTLEVDPTAIHDGQRVVIIDDLIATGGTALGRCAVVAPRRGAGGPCAVRHRPARPRRGGPPARRRPLSRCPDGLPRALMPAQAASARACTGFEAATWPSSARAKWFASISARS